MRASLRLTVDDDGRHLSWSDGTPFFWLGDTAWELFHRLRFADADAYLRARAAQGFTVIQAVALAEFDGLASPTPDGLLPLENNDPTRPNEAYFAHIDRVIRRANGLGMVVGLLPTWGDKWNLKWGVGPEIFTPGNARAYGEWLGRRYAGDAWSGSLVWIAGGDRPIETPAQEAVVRAMIDGLRAGDGGRHLVTFHPAGHHTSLEAFPDDTLDFHMAQTGHCRANDNHRVVRAMRDAARKPCLDAEPMYEDHPDAWKGGELGWFNDYDARRTAWRALFSGACGHTYGCHAVWQFWEPGVYAPVNRPLKSWRESLDLPGARQMRHVRAEAERDFARFRRGAPRPDAVADGRGDGWDAVVAFGDDATFLHAYFPTAEPATLRLGALAGRELAAGWLDPRTGAFQATESVTFGSEHPFAPPASLHPLDWVLRLEVVDA